MTIRARLALAAAAAVAIAVVTVSAIVYIVVRNELRGQVDAGLHTRAAFIRDAHEHRGEGGHRGRSRDADAGTEVAAAGRSDSGGPPGGDEVVARDGHETVYEAVEHMPPPRFGSPGGYVQAVAANGTTARPPWESQTLPVDARVRAVARGDEDAYIEDGRVAGVHVRVLTFPLAEGVAVQVTRPLSEVDESLHLIGLVLLLFTVAGIGGAAALGLAVARTALAPVRDLTDAAEHVTVTGDLTRRIAARGRDELSRLAASFNRMLEALETSVRAQRQLVADASHELRTPLTSLQTNVEVLAQSHELPAAERRQLVDDVLEQLAELTLLVGELVELARAQAQSHEPESVRLDVLVADAVERARRHSPGSRFVVDLEECVVEGVPDTLSRAVSNLLENAVKWSPPDAAIEVTVRDGQVSVRDHGPGIDDRDLPRVFDRFYRAASARNLPGSGLGLAIVRQVAEAHGGRVVAERAEGGGTRMRLSLSPTS